MKNLFFDFVLALIGLSSFQFSYGQLDPVARPVKAVWTEIESKGLGDWDKEFVQKSADLNLTISLGRTEQGLNKIAINGEGGNNEYYLFAVSGQIIVQSLRRWSETKDMRRCYTDAFDNHLLPIVKARSYGLPKGIVTTLNNLIAAKATNDTIKRGCL